MIFSLKKFLQFFDKYKGAGAAILNFASDTGANLISAPRLCSGSATLLLRM
jgi:hypothetical protein